MRYDAFDNERAMITVHTLVAECHWAVMLGTQVANESAKLSMSGYNLHVSSIAHGFLMV